MQRGMTNLDFKLPSAQWLENLREKKVSFNAFRWIVALLRTAAYLDRHRINIEETGSGKQLIENL